MSALAAAAAGEKPAGGAELQDILIVGVGANVLIAIVLLLVISYRRGRAPRLRRLVDLSERTLGVPGWAALPGVGAIGFALLTIWGATWDIGLHIDLGRDEGPLGTSAHYPLLFGLLGMMLMGIMSAGLAPQDPRSASSVAFRLPGVGHVPAAAVLLFSASSFAMLGFPLDDQWHRIFGQDVTLWGPTHTMFIGGVLAAGIGAVLLLVEGARAAGREPFRAKGLLRKPLPAVMAGIFLYLWAAALHEFHWGVPQYREIWQPFLLAFGGAQTMVLARVLAGRGAAFAALVVWLPMQVAMSLVIGGPLETTMPAMPLFIAEALIIEALAARRDWRSPVAFGAVAGLGVGTIGLAANYGWSHVVMPLPWEPALLSEAIPVAIVAGVAGGVLGALLAQALRGDLHGAGSGPLRIAVGAGVVAIALGFNAADTRAPSDVTAAISLTGERTETTAGGGTTRVADLRVRLSDPSLGEDANWVYALGWQGGGRFLDRLERQADGTFVSTKPVPVGGTWKAFVRVHKGRTMLSVPIRMPADGAIDFAGFPARPEVTRTMVPDTKLLQIEKKTDAPMWAWKPATLTVLFLDAMLMVLMGWIAVRLGRMVGRPPTTTTPAGHLDRLVAEVERRVPVAGSA